MDVLVGDRNARFQTRGCAQLVATTQARLETRVGRYGFVFTVDGAIEGRNIRAQLREGREANSVIDTQAGAYFPVIQDISTRLVGVLWFQVVGKSLLSVGGVGNIGAEFVVGVVDPKLDAVLWVGKKVEIKFQIGITNATGNVDRKVGLTAFKTKIVIVIDSGKIEEEFVIKEVVPAQGSGRMPVRQIKEKVPNTTAVLQHITAKIATEEYPVPIR